MSKIYQSVCFKKNSLFTFSLFLSLSLSFFFLYCFLSHQYLLFVILSKVFKRNSSFTKKKKFLFFVVRLCSLWFCCFVVCLFCSTPHSHIRHRQDTDTKLYRISILTISSFVFSHYYLVYTCIKESPIIFRLLI